MPNQYTPTIPAPVRFFAKVEFTDTCWLWRGNISPQGYGYFQPGKRGSKTQAYRWVYEFCVGPIPPGLHIDHLCRVHACVNPDHLEAVTVKVNINRGRRANAEKTHCPSGHAYDAENTYYDRLGWRHCRICKAIAFAKFKSKSIQATVQTL